MKKLLVNVLTPHLEFISSFLFVYWKLSAVVLQLMMVMYSGFPRMHHNKCELVQTDPLWSKISFILSSQAPDCYSCQEHCIENISVANKTKQCSDP